MGVQCTSVRLLLNLVEVMHARRGDVRAQEPHRMLLARSLEACVARLCALRRALPRLLRLSEPLVLYNLKVFLGCKSLSLSVLCLAKRWR